MRERVGKRKKWRERERSGEEEKGTEMAGKTKR